MHPLYRLLQRLDELKLWYRIDRLRPDTVLITAHTPGERLDIDVFDDGHIEHSFFRGDESVESDEQALAQHLWELARADLEE